ncbi:MAG: PhnD/SsuA/transferrin family substrate-binding protein, partial [Ignavibacteriales bacterium]|nr:PhnD/SsuA/transferrin family substrate-binding protein [Ignavibacteriales bacterium]
INSVHDLHGDETSFPSATASAAAMMPKYFLKTRGFDVEKDAICRYVGSQESSIMNVYLGKTKAGCTWPPPWETFIAMHPEVDSALVIKWQTEPLINNGLVVRNDVPAQHLKIFSDLVFYLQAKPEGKEILKAINISCFVPISQNEYMSRVNTFLKKYVSLLGELPGLGAKK